MSAPLAPAPLRGEQLVAYARAVRDCFERGARRGCEQRWLRVAGAPVRVRAPAHVIDATMPALAHLAADPPPAEGSDDGLDVAVWDGRLASWPPPPTPWAWHQRHHPRSAATAVWFNAHGELVEFRDERIVTGFRLSPHKLRVLDLRSGRASYWCSDVDAWPLYERCAPLRKLFAWWTAARGLQLVHAGAVGTPDGGVLLAGKGGSGKSTTALASVAAGLRYAGDDICIVDPEHLSVSSLYNTAKLKTDADVARFPELARSLRRADVADGGGHEKAHVFVHEHDPALPIDGFPLRAVVVPHVTGTSRPRLESVAPALALAALVPSTLQLFPGHGPDVVARLAALTTSVPCYRLELGPDLAAVGELVARVADRGDRGRAT